VGVFFFPWIEGSFGWLVRLGVKSCWFGESRCGGSGYAMRASMMWCGGVEDGCLEGNGRCQDLSASDEVRSGGGVVEAATFID